MVISMEVLQFLIEHVSTLDTMKELNDDDLKSVIYSIIAEHCNGDDKEIVTFIINLFVNIINIHGGKI